MAHHAARRLDRPAPVDGDVDRRRRHRLDDRVRPPRGAPSDGSGRRLASRARPPRPAGATSAGRCGRRSTPAWHEGELAAGASSGGGRVARSLPSAWPARHATGLQRRPVGQVAAPRQTRGRRTTVPSSRAEPAGATPRGVSQRVAHPSSSPAPDRPGVEAVTAEEYSVVGLGWPVRTRPAPGASGRRRPRRSRAG